MNAAKLAMAMTTSASTPALNSRLAAGVAVGLLAATIGALYTVVSATACIFPFAGRRLATVLRRT